MYDRTVNDQALTFCVSGMLWNRSLVMMDTESESLWSHILGEGMRGHYKGQQLRALPADMTTWAKWKQLHPQTTVLAMRRTRHRAYTAEFYKDPEKFVVGLIGGDGPYHTSFRTLMERPLLNVEAGGMPLVVFFDRESTSLRLHVRTVGEQTLDFEVAGDAMRDRATGSIWSPLTGKAQDGALSGKQLESHVGILSYADKWLIFHPESRELKR